MQSYWLAASLITAVIFYTMEGIYAQGGFTIVIFLLLCFTGPILLLGRKLRFGLFDLILSTMDHLEQPAESHRD